MTAVRALLATAARLVSPNAGKRARRPFSRGTSPSAPPARRRPYSPKDAA